MIRLGEVKKGKNWERISFKDWLRYAYEGKFSVKVIFPPSRYPTFTIIFEDPVNGMEVRMNIKADKLREAFQALGLPFKKTDLPALIFEISEAEDNGLIYGLDLDTDNFELSWRGTYWIRRRKEEKEADIEL